VAYASNKNITDQMDFLLEELRAYLEQACPTTASGPNSEVFQQTLLNFIKIEILISSINKNNNNNF